MVVRTNGGTTAADAAAAEELLKSRARASPPRPIFPWRSEPLERPLPRLDPSAGNEEFRPPYAYHIQRLTAYWFLRVPLWQCLLGFGAWRQDLADSAGYAFQQAVTGILTNIYQLPPPTPPAAASSTDSEQQINNDNKKAGDQRHPAFAASEKEQSEDEAVAGSNKEDDDVSSTETAATTTTSTEKKDDASATTTPESKPDAAAAAAPPPPPEKPESQSSVENNKKPDTNASEESKDEQNAASKDPETATSTATTTLNVHDMLIRPLRHMYESAHESGRDQLLIRLQTEPVSAHLINLACLPYVTRDDDPEKLPAMRQVRMGRGGFQTVMRLLDEDLRRHGKLETTVEAQVLVVCREIFQVRDRTTGQVLQGSLEGDGEEQVVGHVVRLECTSGQELLIGSSDLRYYQSDWQITDIDDLLSGPVAWYEKE